MAKWNRFYNYHFSTEITLIITVLARFLQAMEVDWSLVKSEKYFESMIKMARIGRIISIISGSMAHTANTFGFVVQKWYNLESYYIQDPDPRLTMNLFWLVYVPIDTSNTANYICLLSLQFYASCIGCVIYCCFDSFVVMLVLHLCGQLQCVEISVAEIGTHGSTNSCFRTDLRRIVQRHESIMRLAGDLEDSFSLVLLLSLIGCTLTFCFEGYALIRLLDRGQLGFFQLGFSMTVASGAFLHLFFCCWAGDFLSEQSMAVGKAIHCSKWYNLSDTEARTLMMMGFKAFVPLELTAGKFAALSLNLFVNVKSFFRVGSQTK